MHLHPLGDRAVVIQLGATIDETTHRRVRTVCTRLEERPVPGMIEYVPAFASVAVHYDPARVPPAAPNEDDSASPYARLVAALKQFRKERRALATAWSSLRQLNLGP